MNKEKIKEVIDNLNGVVKGIYRMDEAGLEIEDIEIILNYITNLQEENERLNLELSGYRQAILNDDNLMGLKSRIDKAIEYIRSEYTITDDDVYLALYSSDGTLDKLESILKGEK